MTLQSSTHFEQLKLELPPSKIVDPPGSKPNSKLARRLRKLGDNLDDKIEYMRRPMTQNPTPRRNKQYQGRLHDAANLERTQKALYALADAHERGNCPDCLKGVKTKGAIEALVCTRWVSRGYYEGSDSREFIDVSEAGKALQAMITDSPEEQAAATRQAELDALEAHVKLRIGQIPGFFPTPRHVADMMVRLADIHLGMRILEPSAGSGAIADVIRERHPNVELWCIEFNTTLCKLLKLKGHETTHVEGGCDFLRYPASAKPYDRIIMNPPFEKRQDIAHVLHAYDCLAPGGRLVTVMSEGTFFAQNGMAKRFREWLDERAWDEIDLPASTFKESGTGVKARILVIDKEE